MKIKRDYKTPGGTFSRLATVAAILAVTGAPTAIAAEVTWAPGGLVNNGGGWTSTANAWSGANWVDGSDAVFNRTTTSTATVTTTGGGTITANSIALLFSTVDSARQQINAGEVVINTTGNLDVQSGATLDFRAILGGPNGLNLTGGGLLSLSNTANSYTGTISISEGSMIAIGAGSSQNGVLGNASNSIYMDNGSIRYSIGSTGTFARDIELGAGGGRIEGRRLQGGSFPQNWSGDISGIGGITLGDDGVVGAGAASGINLSGDNTYQGGTVLAFGSATEIRAVASNSSSLGTGDVTLTQSSRLEINALLENDIFVTTDTSIVERTISNGADYDLGTTGVLESQLAGGTDTEVAIIDGTNGSGSTQNLTASFAAGLTATNDELRISDVVSLDGTGSELFVLALTLDTLGPDISYVAWLDGTDTWVNAVLGNSGNNASLAQQGYEGAFLGGVGSFQDTYGTALGDYVGAWGVDTATGSVWAVLNHNSDFSVVAVPEPSTVWALVCAGFVVVVHLARRRADRLA